jgi:hypothetical protein
MSGKRSAAYSARLRRTHLRPVGRLAVAEAPVGDEDLLNRRPCGARRIAKRAVVDRQDAPADHLEPFFAGDLFEQTSKLLALVLRSRQKDETDAVLPLRRQRDAQRTGHLPEEPVRHLNQHPRSVTGVRLAPTGTAMQQVDENPQPLLNHPMRAAPFDVDDKPDAACVVFEGGVVQADGGRRSGNTHNVCVFMPYADAEGKYNDGIELISKSDE